MTFDTRYKQLNNAQRQAVDTIDGPLLVVAGPGTGKTELLSMRAANILRQTDTLPSSILCLTFTDSGAAAMRKRLGEIIGTDAYKIAVHTFHSFGTEVIGQNREYFYRGARMKPADELAQYEIVREIFGELSHNNPLAGKNAGEFTYLKETLQTISELKRSGLTSDELRLVIDEASRTIDTVERDIAKAFLDRISKKTVDSLAPIAHKVAELETLQLPPAITPYMNVLSLSLAHAIDTATTSNSTKPITTWKNTWCEKNDRGDTVLKDRKSLEKLRAVAHVYYEYLHRMEAAELYDYDDMILQVVHAFETHADLAANIREKYLYVMVDEFQDTNLAQLRILFDLTLANEHPNVMAVGDDDQAIFSFQGADISNIHRFRHSYHNPKTVVLTDNYRSTKPILDAARKVVLQGGDRLEYTMDFVKELSSHQMGKAEPRLVSLQSPDAERSFVANEITKLLKNNVPAESIAVLARRHSELVALLPFLTAQGIRVNYERSDNVLDHDIIRLVEHLFLIIDAIHTSDHERADSLLPEIVGHPAFGFKAIDVWKLSLQAHRNRAGWLETMQATTQFKNFAEWLIEQAVHIHEAAIETQIDTVLGTPSEPPRKGQSFASPIYDHYFSKQALAAQPDTYLDALEALRTVRDKLREHTTGHAPTVADFLDYIEAHRELGSQITAVRHRANYETGMVNLMTAHKSKGLEFDHVFVIGLVDSSWGERVRGNSRLIRYPANLPIGAPGGNYDERIRLAYVALTRAKNNLSLSYFKNDAGGKEMQVASFLSSIAPIDAVATTDNAAQLARTEIDWRGYLTKPVSADMRTLLAPTLEKYKLSATHLGNFLDVSQGGPQRFLMNNLLRFPQAKSPSASFGTAIHATLQQAHDYIRANHSHQPTEDIIGNFERILAEQYLSPRDHETYLARGIEALSSYLQARYRDFSESDRTELNFSSQDVVIGDARLTGALDLATIDEQAKTMRVTDYKTGKPSRDWKGKTDYEKIKLHKYRQQLMFYQLLVENSRDYSKYAFGGGVLQFVEPTASGDIIALDDSFTSEELATFKHLISAVWQSIIALDLPDTSNYEPNIKGVQAFESDLIDKYP